jgi:hypothetical protein
LARPQNKKITGFKRENASANKKKTEKEITAPMKKAKV